MGETEWRTLQAIAMRLRGLRRPSHGRQERPAAARLTLSHSEAAFRMRRAPLRDQTPGVSGAELSLRCRMGFVHTRPEDASAGDALEQAALRARTWTRFRCPSSDIARGADFGGPGLIRRFGSGPRRSTAWPTSARRIDIPSKSEPSSPTFRAKAGPAMDVPHHRHPRSRSPLSCLGGSFLQPLLNSAVFLLRVGPQSRTRSRTSSSLGV